MNDYIVVNMAATWIFLMWLGLFVIDGAIVNLLVEAITQTEWIVIVAVVRTLVTTILSTYLLR